MKPLRVAVFGIFGSGNLGNHGSLDAMLQFLRTAQPDAELTCVCAAPEVFEQTYGIRSLPISWYHRHEGRHSFPVSTVLKVVGKFADAVRTARWIRHQDVVVIPGMGVLEATVPVRPWGFPYALFLTVMWGRVFGTKVALVSVGANVMRQRSTRWFVRQAARFAHYRSFRDDLSRDAIRKLGVDTSSDRVFPDLAFALPRTPSAAATTGTIGVGVMAFYGAYEERQEAADIHTGYVRQLTEFVGWLLDAGYRVRLFIGDPADLLVVDKITTALGEDKVSYEEATSLGELMTQMSAVEAVIGSRYHNVLSALKVGTPTISISYAHKNDVLMQDMGQGEFCQPIRELDARMLIEQFTRLRERDEEIRLTLEERNRRNIELLAEQDAILTETLFGVSAPAGLADAA